MTKAEACPVAVTARLGPVTRPALFSEVEGSVQWTMEFADAAVAKCVASYDQTVGHFRAEAARGWAELGQPFGYAEPTLTTSQGPVVFPEMNEQVAQLDGIADCLIRGSRSPAPGEMGRRDVAIMQAIYAAATSGKRMVVNT
jgi:hypothetical protein